METQLSFWIVLGTAVTTAFVHTMAGPDHYLPFIVLAKSRNWTLRRTLVLTLLAGVGHIASALLLAVAFLLFGEWFSAEHREWIDGTRGNLAAWFLTALGVAYALWGVRHALRNRPHVHFHRHENGVVHSHEHRDFSEHAHPHDAGRGVLITWSLFIIFVLGPCEAMLPILAAAALIGRTCLFASTVTFSAVTILTMLGAVTAGYFGVTRLSLPFLERWSHVMAGTVIAACGAGILFLGL